MLVSLLLTLNISNTLLYSAYIVKVELVNAGWETHVCLRQCLNQNRT